MKTIEQRMLEQLEQLQFVWHDDDRYYHKESGYRCVDCGQYIHEGHHEQCEIGNLLKEIKEKHNDFQ